MTTVSPSCCDARVLAPLSPVLDHPPTLSPLGSCSLHNFFPDDSSSLMDSSFLPPRLRSNGTVPPASLSAPPLAWLMTESPFFGGAGVRAYLGCAVREGGASVRLVLPTCGPFLGPLTMSGLVHRELSNSHLPLPDGPRLLLYLVFLYSCPSASLSVALVPGLACGFVLWRLFLCLFFQAFLPFRLIQSFLLFQGVRVWGRGAPLSA